jgi:hypothetical protein
MHNRFLLYFIILILPSIQSFGQAQDSLRKKEIFIGIGPAAYKGDLSNRYDKWSMVFNAGIKFNRFRKLNGNFNITIGQVSGQSIGYSFDDGSGVTTTPNSFVSTKIVGLNYELHYNIIHKEKFKFYLSQGIGILRFNPENEFNESLVDLSTSRALGEVYGNIAISFPTQLGLLYTLPNEYSLGFQIGYWGTATDYLDNISQWSSSTGNDNILSARFEIHIPVIF